MKYKLQKNYYGDKPVCVLRLEDNASIPMHESNTDYQAYLKWLDEGNTPLPADE
jgi:hypothetical protein